MQDTHWTSVKAGFCSRLCFSLLYHAETAINLWNGSSSGSRYHCAGLYGPAKCTELPFLVIAGGRASVEKLCVVLGQRDATQLVNLWLRLIQICVNETSGYR
jgi:hypothetical protein